VSAQDRTTWAIKGFCVGVLVGVGATLAALSFIL